LQLICEFPKILLFYPARRIFMALKDKFIVLLTGEQRDELERLATTGQHPAATITRARILLKADAQGDGWADDRIAEALDTSTATVARIRKKFVQQGLEAAMQRQRPTGRLYRKLDGAQEAQLAALACSPPPEGQARWTMRLLADKLVELEVVQSIDPATVWRTLKKRDQAVAEAAVGAAAQGQRRLRGRDGGRAGGLRPAPRPEAPPGLHR
jgi:transposase